jgi:hypothetical protein
MAVQLNTREYEWNDISLFIGNTEIRGFTGVKYTIEQEKEPLYAKGNKAYSVQFGNISVKGSFGVTTSVREALNDIGIDNLLSIRSMTAIVQYGNPSSGVPPMTKTITGISFTKLPDEWEQGAKFQKNELDFIALDVQTK